ncbi:MAG: hypothetical protein FWD60_10485 [Candidatus Azobacteroides sp.]|nr:hypothetical protein [Candidatus Azobacteroides sp.]
MKQLLLLLALFTGITFSLYSQNKIVFAYDDAGNRTSRVMQTVTLPNKAPAVIDSTNIATESLFDITIKVYPNPTYGQLTIEIEDYKIDKPLNVLVFDRNNQLLQQHVMKDTVIYLDLSQYPPATWYIVTFMLNGERRDFKIIKL